MGTAERREREKVQRQEAILDAAEKVFFEKGFKIATMDDVAEAAELSKGTLYLYFKSKEHLYLGIDLRGTKILREAFAKAVENEPDGLSKSLAVGKAYVQFSIDFPDYFLAMTYRETLDQEAIEALKDDPLVQECYKIEHSALKILVDAIEIGKADGSIRSEVDPLFTALLLWAESNGVILLQRSRGKHFQEEHGLGRSTLLDEFFEFVRRSLTPDKS
jgi:AcrR family transcriptional regulator